MTSSESGATASSARCCRQSAAFHRIGASRSASYSPCSGIRLTRTGQGRFAVMAPSVHVADHLRPAVPGVQAIRRAVAQRGMAAPPAVEEGNVVEQLSPGLWKAKSRGHRTAPRLPATLAGHGGVGQLSTASWAHKGLPSGFSSSAQPGIRDHPFKSHHVLLPPLRTRGFSARSLGGQRRTANRPAGTDAPQAAPRRRPRSQCHPNGSTSSTPRPRCRKAAAAPTASSPA